MKATFKYNEALGMAFELMPDTFSTLAFNTACRELDVPDEVLESRTSKHFLFRNCSRIGKSMWEKKESKPKEKYNSRKMHSTKTAYEDFHLYEKAFALMGDTFTSGELAREAKKMGANPKHTQQGSIGFWLSDRSDVERIAHSTWEKVTQTEAEQHEVKYVPNLVTSYTEVDAISFLKSLGYRIMKPVSQWEEL